MEPVQVGELYNFVMRALDKPNNLPNYEYMVQQNDGPFSMTHSLTGKKVHLKNIKNYRKKWCKNLRTELRIAKRFDVENDLMNFVWDNYVSEKTPNEFYNYFDNFRLPFPRVWVEFDSKTIEHGFEFGSYDDYGPEMKNLINAQSRTFGCLITESKQQMEGRENPVNALNFKFFHENYFHAPVIVIPTDRSDRNIRELRAHNFDVETNERIDEIQQYTSLHAFGFTLMPPGIFIDRQGRTLTYEDNTYDGERTYRHWDESKGYIYYGNDSYRNLCDNVRIDDNFSFAFRENHKSLNILYLSYIPTALRFVIYLMNVLNYPWTKTEKVMGVIGRKSKTPRIAPQDHYYRAKIALPKEGIEIRDPLPGREEHYGVRQHQVRGHWRILRNEHGEFKRRTWVKAHTRGDSKLGVVHKDYALEADKKEIAERANYERL
tara:strand:+ start:372 stop:1670 length:1299 start_codon:yes stop_codon:yes gene_type:complete